MFLSMQDIWNYDRDGYVLVPELFSGPGVAVMLSKVETGGRVAQTRMMSWG